MLKKKKISFTVNALKGSGSPSFPHLRDVKKKKFSFTDNALRGSGSPSLPHLRLRFRFRQCLERLRFTATATLTSTLEKKKRRTPRFEKKMAI
jgi:hypothetical protein